MTFKQINTFENCSITNGNNFQDEVIHLRLIPSNEFKEETANSSPNNSSLSSSFVSPETTWQGQDSFEMTSWNAYLYIKLYVYNMCLFASPDFFFINAINMVQRGCALEYSEPEPHLPVNIQPSFLPLPGPWTIKQ